MDVEETHATFKSHPNCKHKSEAPSDSPCKRFFVSVVTRGRPIALAEKAAHERTLSWPYGDSQIIRKKNETLLNE
jgi:hypothetical protein